MEPPEVCDVPDTMRRAADALRLYVQGEAWISVDERLPENDDTVRVLAFGPSAECERCGCGKVWDANAEAFHSKAWLAEYKVTHWRPMIDTPASISSGGASK